LSDQTLLEIDDISCTVAAATQYGLLLSVLLWTLGRAALIYQKYVLVFDQSPWLRVSNDSSCCRNLLSVFLSVRNISTSVSMGKEDPSFSAFTGTFTCLSS